MRFQFLFCLALASLAQAVDVQVVSVGRSAANQTGLKFWPESITAAAGSMVQFQFWVGNHTITQSNFDNPCVPVSNVNSTVQGIYSGYMPVKASSGRGMIPTYTITIKDDKPIWLYCSQGQHCQGGMSMVINENTSANSTRSLKNYKSLAQSATDSNQLPASSSDGGSSTSPSSTPTGGTSTQTAVPAAAPRLSSPSTLLLALVASLMLL